ncbi:unnamed protein product [Ectocarpus sp. 12 AP-2014]
MFCVCIFTHKNVRCVCVCVLIVVHAKVVGPLTSHPYKAGTEHAVFSPDQALTIPRGGGTYSCFTCLSAAVQPLTTRPALLRGTLREGERRHIVASASLEGQEGGTKP